MLDEVVLMGQRLSRLKGDKGAHWAGYAGLESK